MNKIGNINEVIIPNKFKIKDKNPPIYDIAFWIVKLSIFYLLHLRNMLLTIFLIKE